MAHPAEEYTELWRGYGIDLPLSTSQILKFWPGGKSNALPLPSIEAQSTYQSLEEIQKALIGCNRCTLCEERKSIVFGYGNPKAELMFVGEGPGADEDLQGLPFVGQAGQLLNKIIEAMQLTREKVYIANIVKCRPPGNRVPEPVEIETCFPFLKAQIEIVQPRFIVALGLTAASTLTGNTTSMSNLRGNFHTLLWDSSIRVMPTYHPAYLLRNSSAKKHVWEDMKAVLNELKK